MLRARQFTLGTLFLLMLVAATMAAAGRYLYEAQMSTVTSNRARLVIFVLLLPMALLIAVQLFWELRRWWRRRDDG